MIFAMLCILTLPLHLGGFTALEGIMLGFALIADMGNFGVTILDPKGFLWGIGAMKFS